jgi:hypothetical protein
MCVTGFNWTVSVSIIKLVSVSFKFSFFVLVLLLSYRFHYDNDSHGACSKIGSRQDDRFQVSSYRCVSLSVSKVRCLERGGSSAKLRSTDSANPRAVLSRVRPRYRHLLWTPVPVSVPGIFIRRIVSSGRMLLEHREGGPARIQ